MNENLSLICPYCSRKFTNFDKAFSHVSISNCKEKYSDPDNTTELFTVLDKLGKLFGISLMEMNEETQVFFEKQVSSLYDDIFNVMGFEEEKEEEQKKEEETLLNENTNALPFDDKSAD